MATEISKLSIILTSNAGTVAGGLKGSQTALSGLQQQAGSASGAMGGLGSSLVGVLGPAAAVAAAVGLVAFAFNTFKEKENAVAQLNARIKSTGGAAGFTSGQLQQMAADLQQINGTSKAATIGAEALLLTFTNIRGDVFKEALTGVEDLAVGMTQDLQTSVVQLGKALNDPITGLTALHKIGVNFTEQQKQQIKTMQELGDTAGAQRVILKELAYEFGGSAAAKAQTLQGRIEAAKNALTDMGEEIFSAAAPALKQLAEAVKNVADFIATHEEAVKSVTNVLLAPLTALGKLASAFSDGGKSAQEAQANFDAIKGKMTAVKTATEELTKAQEELDKKVGDTVARLTEQVATFGMSGHQADVYKLQAAGVTGEVIDQVKALADHLDALEAQKKAYDELAAAAKKYAEDIKTPFEKLADQLAEINRLEKAGLLSADQAERASNKAAGDVEKTFSLGKAAKAKSFSPAGAGDKLDAIERRFTAGFSTANVSAQDKMLIELQKQTKAIEAQKQYLKKLAEQRKLVVSPGA